METKHDRALLQILHEEKNITNFLDVFFGFLYRCTDFYIEAKPDQRQGFPSGVAENLVVSVFEKWKTDDKRTGDSLKDQPDEDNESATGAKAYEPPVQPPVQPSDSYNGAIRDNYTWSQSIVDLDVLVKIPEYLKSSKDLKVDITANGIRLSTRTEILRGNNDTGKYRDEGVNSDWTTIFNERFSFKTRKEESVWSMVPGKHVIIHLEKASERWWEAFVEGEPKIELSKIDCSRHIDDLGLNERMKLQELMWNHRQKLLGKTPTSSDQPNMAKVSKRGWDLGESPFKGSDYSN